jgi:hypothetical protein
MCQVCIMNPPLDMNLTAGTKLIWDTFIANQDTKLCANGDTTIKATTEMIIRASLQVLVQNPYYCYFKIKFGGTASPVPCLVSGNYKPGGHFTHGTCEAMGKMNANTELSVEVSTPQGSSPCMLRGNSFICLSALEIP